MGLEQEDRATYRVPRACMYGALLPALAHSRRVVVGVARLTPPAGEAHLPTPRVAFARLPQNVQDLGCVVWQRPQHDGHGGSTRRWQWHHWLGGAQGGRNARDERHLGVSASSA